MPSFGTIHHVSLSVRDLRRSKQWYGQTLGLRVARELEREDFARAILGFSGQPSLLGLTQHRFNEGEDFSEARTGMDHVAFSVASLSELELWVERFESMGMAHSRPREGLVVFRDPDNIQLELAIG